MVIVIAIEIFDVERDTGILREGLEPLFEEFSIHVAELGFGEVHLPDQIGALRDVDGNAGAGFVHRNDGCP